MVGTDRLSESGYFREDRSGETDQRSFSPLLYRARHAILRVPKGHADISLVADKVHLPRVLFQPMAAEDAASGVAKHKMVSTIVWRRH